MACKISYGQKIYASYLSLLIFSIVIGGVGISTLRHVIRDKDLLAYEYAQDLSEVDSLHIAVEKMVAAARGYFLSGRDRFLARMATNHEELLTHLDKLRGNHLTHNAEDLANFTIAEKNYEQWLEKLVAWKKTSSTLDGVQAKFESELEPRHAALESSLDLLIKTNQTFLRMEKLHSASTSAHAVNLMIAIVTFFLSLGTGIALVTARMLRNLYDEARTEVRLREDIVSVVAHDLRTPLTALMLRTQLLLRPLVKPRDDSYIRRALEANLQTGARMAQLIEDLLDLAKIRAGHFSLRCVECDAAKPLNLAISMVQPIAQEKSISIKVDTMEPELKLDCDCDRVAQILQNLLSNAIKFSPNGSEILVKTSKKDTFALISVEDHGIGIPASQFRYVFDRFKQARKSDSKIGTGLGLTIAKEMTEAQGGSISLESTPGQGSKFSFTIPLSPSA